MADPTPDPFAGGADPFAEATPSVAEDVGKSVRAKAIQGPLEALGTPADYAKAVEEYGKKGLSAIRDYIPSWMASPEQIDKALQDPLPAWTPQGAAARVLPTSEELVEGAEKRMPGVVKYDPKTWEGRHAGSVTEMATNPINWAGPGSLVGKAASNVLGGVGAQLGEDITGSKAGRVVGGTIGAVAPSAATRLASPVAAINPEHAAAAARLGQAGVDLSAGRATGRRTLRNLQDRTGTMPLSGDAAIQFDDRAREQINNRLFQSAGHAADKATTDQTNAMWRNLDRQFNQTKARNNIDLTGNNGRQTARQFNSAITEYEAQTPVASRLPALEEARANLQNALNNGGLYGADYHAWRSQLAAFARNAVKNPQTVTAGDALFTMVEALDDAMERSMAAARSPDLGRFRQLRQQWRNASVITESIDEATDNVDPRKLISALKRRDERGFQRGTGNLDQFARDAARIMSDPVHMHTPWSMLAYMLAGGVEGSTLGRGLHNPAVNRYLANQRFVPMRGQLPGLAPSIARGVDALGPSDPFATEDPFAQ